MWFESLLVFILFKFKKYHISGIRVVQGACVLPLRVTWFEPWRSKAIYILRDILVVTAVSVANTDTCERKSDQLEEALHKSMMYVRGAWAEMHFLRYQEPP